MHKLTISTKHNLSTAEACIKLSFIRFSIAEVQIYEPFINPLMSGDGLVNYR